MEPSSVRSSLFSPRIVWEASIIAMLLMTLLIGSYLAVFPINHTEAWGFVTGACCVWLVVRENIWNWPIGLANNVVFVILFWHARLFADMGLQFVYIALGIWGWWHWLHGGKERKPLQVSRARKCEWYGIVVALTLGTFLLRWILVQCNGSAPFLDAFTTMLCLCAQYLLCRKRLENWYLWILADLIYVPLYASRNLPLTAVLYGLFIILCLMGLKHWSNQWKRQKA